VLFAHTTSAIVAARHENNAASREGWSLDTRISGQLMQCNMITNTQSSTSTAHVMLRAQNCDPRCVVLPNMCHNSLIQTTDGKKAKCFSVAIRSPNLLPHDKWSLVALVASMPEQDDIDRDHIYVDHITCGILQDNRLQVMMGDNGRIDGLRMYPPNDDIDADKHWKRLAGELTRAKITHK